jgi:hypothetical protein
MPSTQQEQAQGSLDAQKLSNIRQNKVIVPVSSTNLTNDSHLPGRGRVRSLEGHARLVPGPWFRSSGVSYPLHDYKNIHT